MRWYALLVAAWCSGACDVSPAAPTPDQFPRPTMTVLPGTFRTSVYPSGRDFLYEPCVRLTNPLRGRDATVHEFELTPIGADGTPYPPITQFRGSGLSVGADVRECWLIVEINARHDPPLRYRLRVTYYFIGDFETRASLEGTSTLAASP